MKFLLVAIACTLLIGHALMAPKKGIRFKQLMKDTPEIEKRKVFQKFRERYEMIAMELVKHEGDHDGPPRAQKDKHKGRVKEPRLPDERPPSKELKDYLKAMQKDRESTQARSLSKQKAVQSPRQDADEKIVDVEDQTVQKRWSTQEFFTQGNDPDLLMEYLPSMYNQNDPREGLLRGGESTDTHSCDQVRAVPSELRDPDVFYSPVHSFYVKYTEAYNIPILGSQYVTDEGLRRACYEVRFFFAHRFDERNFYYKLYGRFALIGDVEQQTSLPEYSTWDKSWDDRVRGLGPALHIPLTSAGDDNQRCKVDDRYSDQDILGHEGGHGLHLMSSAYSIPGFSLRLKQLFDDAITSGKYDGSYAGSNPEEYWAMAVQFYLNAYNGPGYVYPGLGPEGAELRVRDRESLQIYDPDIVDMLDETMPCTNQFINRCTWKDCDLSSFDMILDRSWNAKSKCYSLALSYQQPNASMCAALTCYYLGNAFNYKNGYCQPLECTVQSDDVYEHLEILQGNKGFDIYQIYAIPEMNLQAESSTSMAKHCTTRRLTVKTGINTEESRCSLVTENKLMGPTPTTDSKSKCKKRGGCFKKGVGCVYPEQSCADRSPYCPMWARTKHNGVPGCHYNPGMMLRICPTSCNACDYAYRIQQVKEVAEDLCQDILGDRIDPALDCASMYYKYFHALSCNECSLETNWRDLLDIEDYPYF